MVSFDPKERNRSWNFVLYPDCAEHSQALEKIKKSYKYLGILHDKDVDDYGNVKKPHYHIVVTFENARSRASLCKELGLTLNSCEKCGSLDKSVEYLIHLTQADKHLYNIDDVFGNNVKSLAKLQKSVNDVDKTEELKVLEIIGFIDGCDGYLSLKSLGSWCAKNGYWAEFRRACSFFMALVKEHNECIGTVLIDRSTGAEIPR